MRELARYCAISHGHPAPVDPAEPERVATAIHALGLNYVVITPRSIGMISQTVERPCSPETVLQTRQRLNDCRIEVLIPDFRKRVHALRTVLDARPDVLNHNTETVPRLCRMARIRRAILPHGSITAPIAPACIRAGHSDKDRPHGRAWRRSMTSWRRSFKDLRNVGCEILTIGQYLRPHPPSTPPMVRYYHPDEFWAEGARDRAGTSSTSNRDHWSGLLSRALRQPTRTKPPPEH